MNVQLSNDSRLWKVTNYLTIHLTKMMFEPGD